MTASSSSVERPIPEPPARQERIPLAILFMVSAGRSSRFPAPPRNGWSQTYPVGEVLFSRVFVSLIVFSAFALPTSGLAVLHTRRPGAHVLRSMSQFTSQTLLLIAFSMMPLASATAINFSAPLFAALASVVFLKESVGPARWAALVVGFLGVLIVTSPGSETFQIGALYALGNSLLFGTVTVGVRGMTRTELAKTLTIYQLIWLSIFYGLTLPFFFVMPTWSDAADRRQRHLQHARPVLVDARDPSGADLGGGAVPVSVADLGDGVRLCAVGRCADGRPSDRLGDRGRLRPVSFWHETRPKMPKPGPP